MAVRPEITLRVTRGVTRLFTELDWSHVTEMPLRSGRRVDVMALDPAGEIIVVEVKSDMADYLADRKWHEYLDFCDRFFFAVAPDFPRDQLPDDPKCGLILADQYEAVIFREAETDKLNAARRKSLTLKLARTAARRLTALLEVPPGQPPA
ncbi:MmcB family DNA repair protein [Nisaea acidiphila]|uniref:MmcB family DNA repair protein n=1 Tax=Nisaea acidiphila TaxID=1862145 RepID=A0A9J7AZS3_9PROT|nr:MmcB family DNA repair protein [Nisaea acidiphila]UUX51748.1 MmcB family DNA repair protein [Nisaea acidiphila]